MPRTKPPTPPATRERRVQAQVDDLRRKVASLDNELDSLHDLCFRREETCDLLYRTLADLVEALHALPPAVLLDQAQGHLRFVLQEAEKLVRETAAVVASWEPET